MGKLIPKLGIISLKFVLFTLNEVIEQIEIFSRRNLEREHAK